MPAGVRSRTTTRPPTAAPGRCSWARTASSPTPVTAGEPTAFEIGIRPVHHRFAAGHRIGVRVSGGAADVLTPNASPVDVTVSTGPGTSTLAIPTVPE
ncbi:CocE/NonD family hydrolase C-terminal non-catalytic domain-containing protein [Parafrankia sp. FMc6]|uniref:CocE/NonD family hydrolase C-terminal non-catalytic domain-containing protein n=1 Tax=Parafrankia soli TaxID=2599596 RepID=UPI0034D5AC9E